MTFKDYILTYKVNDKIVANLFDYYDIFIKHLDRGLSSIVIITQILFFVILKTMLMLTHLWVILMIRD